MKKPTIFRSLAKLPQPEFIEAVYQLLLLFKLRSLLERHSIRVILGSASPGRSTMSAIPWLEVEQSAMDIQARQGKRLDQFSEEDLLPFRQELDAIVRQRLDSVTQLNGVSGRDALQRLRGTASSSLEEQKGSSVNASKATPTFSFTPKFAPQEISSAIASDRSTEGSDAEAYSSDFGGAWRL